MLPVYLKAKSAMQVTTTFDTSMPFCFAVQLHYRTRELGTWISCQWKSKIREKKNRTLGFGDRDCGESESVSQELHFRVVFHFAAGSVHAFHHRLCFRWRETKSQKRKKEGILMGFTRVQSPLPPWAQSTPIRPGPKHSDAIQLGFYSSSNALG